MDVADDPTGPEPSVSRSLVIDKHRVRRPIGKGFWTLAAVVPVMLTAVVGLTQGPAVEKALRTEAQGALAAQGIKGVKIVADGRFLTAKVPTGKDPAVVETVLSAVEGVTTVQTTSVYASPAEAKACANLQHKVDRATQGQRITFVGGSTQLTVEGRERALAVAQLLRACPSAVATIGGHTDSHIYDGADVSFARAQVILRLLKAERISSTRLKPRGYADQFPIAEGDTLAAQARNQRGSIAVAGQ